MLPRLVPEILILYAFCDVVGVGVGVVGGIGDSRSWMYEEYTLVISGRAVCPGALQ